ncbi:transmembrane protein 242 [Eurytemora carolleeae]|uniref:transmembrane protein 242 n=1 Tax=Eurytemora carolleeae TaxID=1294199 RepID=UPI000C780060|nr:transmembrane protein 242 [Eurytemora carolleeae]|eukprot:XP_023339951.1 transmembrane protein 242-like [Eurytemora affinis]
MSVKEEKEGMGDEESGSKKDGRSEIPYKVKAGAFLTTAAGIGMLAGFGTAMASAKKQDPRHFDAGMIGIDPDSLSKAQSAQAKARYLQESGASLATRALGYGTLYAFAGCGLLFFSVWKMMGVNNLTEFRDKVGGILPRIRRNDPPQSRTEFTGLNDLMQYLIDKDKEEKEIKKAQR